MANPIPFLKPQFFDDNGDPLAGGKLFSYLATTTTPLTTYADRAGGVTNTNPVILDSAGRADVFLGNSSYKLVLYDANDVLVWSEDNVDGTGSGGNSTAAWATHNVTDGQAAADLVGETVDGASFTSAAYDVEIKRGTTVRSLGVITLVYTNGTWSVDPGLFSPGSPHGVTFSVSQASTIAQLRAALDVGAGDGTIKLSRRPTPA